MGISNGVKTPLLILVGIIIGIGLIIFGSRSDSQPSTFNTGEGASSTPSPELQIELDKLEADAVVLGDSNAPVTLIEFGDYQCTFCAKFFNETKQALEDKYVKTGKLKVIFVDFAINGRESVNAAEASWCAADQGSYWEYHNKLFEERKGYNVGAFKEDQLLSYAGDIGLDTETFASCYQSRTYKDKVANSTRRAPLFGARGTPAFLLNGQLIPGAQPLSFFEGAIEQELNKVN